MVGFSQCRVEAVVAERAGYRLHNSRRRVILRAQDRSLQRIEKVHRDLTGRSSCASSVKNSERGTR